MHDKKVVQAAFALALLLCLGLFVWLLVLLVKEDERAVQGINEQPTEIANGTGSTGSGSGSGSDGEDEPADVTSDEPVDDPGDSDPDPEEDPEVDPPAPEFVKWVTQDKLVGFIGKYGQSVFIADGGMVVAEGDSSMYPGLTISRQLLARGESETAEQAYARVVEDLMAEMTVQQTCRREVIDGVAADCYSVLEDRTQWKVNTLILDHYVIMIKTKMNDVNGGYIFENLNWFPDAAFQEGSYTITPSTI